MNKLLTSGLLQNFQQTNDRLEETKNQLQDQIKAIDKDLVRPYINLVHDQLGPYPDHTFLRGDTNVEIGRWFKPTAVQIYHSETSEAALDIQYENISGASGKKVYSYRIPLDKLALSGSQLIEKLIEFKKDVEKRREMYFGKSK